MELKFKLVAAVLMLLGVVAFFVGDKNSTPDDLTLTFTEYDSLVANPVPTITPVELADFLMKQEHHYNLIDLQGEAAGYRIPTSESYSANDFLAKNIPVNETIFLYAKSEIEAVQLYYLLTIRGYFKVKVLSGGTDGWYKDVLRPNRTDISASQLPHREKITRFFGGTFNSQDVNLLPVEVNLEKKQKKHHGC